MRRRLGLDIGGGIDFGMDGLVQDEDLIVAPTTSREKLKKQSSFEVCKCLLIAQRRRSAATMSAFTVIFFLGQQISICFVSDVLSCDLLLSDM